MPTSKRRIRARWPVSFALALAAFGIGFLANVPAVQWRVILWHARFRDTFITRDLYLPTPLPANQRPNATPAVTTDQPTPDSATATPLPPTATSEPLPASVRLDGFRYEAQKPNACGPASLAVLLSFHDWPGSQADTLTFLKPKLWDKNVRPDEMLAFVESVGLRGIVRANGTIELLKRLLHMGLPVMVQKGIWLGERDGWLGHYETLTGYDDGAQVFIAQDTFQGPDFEVGYEQMSDEWRAFNYTYLVVYLPELEGKVMALIGSDVDRELNATRGLERALSETTSSQGELRAFALFNQGTNLVTLYRYQEAALAFDEARTVGLPWRMLWYQTGPYKAYFYSGRYQDVLDLANATLARTGGLEESMYWRGQARQVTGDVAGAVEDYREALKSNPNFTAAQGALEYLGYTIEEV